MNGWNSEGKIPSFDSHVHGVLECPSVAVEKFGRNLDTKNVQNEVV